MTLRELMGNGAPEVEISGLAYSSQGVGPGALFFCVRGFKSDGHDFAPDAVERGAVALVCERPLDLGVPEVIVEDVRAAMGPAAVRFYGDPTADLDVVGMTGTNGKTTTAFLVRHLLEADGRACGLLGTVKRVVAGREEEVERTTPEAIDLQATFRAHARRRRPGLRDGGLLARAGAGARGRDPLRLPGVHQPDPGPPRLPRHDGGLLRGQAAAVRAPGDLDRERRRRLRSPHRRRGGLRDVRDRPRGRLSRARRRLRPDGLALSLPAAGRRAPAGLPAAGAVQRPERARCRGGGALAGRAGRDHRRRAAAASAACRAASSRSTRARTSACWWTTRTRPRRWRTCCAPRARSPRGGCTWCSAPAGTATAASAR